MIRKVYIGFCLDAEGELWDLELGGDNFEEAQESLKYTMEIDAAREKPMECYMILPITKEVEIEEREWDKYDKYGEWEMN